MRGSWQMPTVLWKAIKPKRFKAEAIRQAIEYEAKFIADEVYTDFLLTVSKWSRQPKFDKLVQVGPESVEILVGTDNVIYRYVSEGTRPHVIKPTGPWPLRFKGTYKAKTIPGLITSRDGGASGGEVFAMQVYHPGTEARKFEETIGKKWQPRFKKRMVAALKKGAKATGHGTQ